MTLNICGELDCETLDILFEDFNKLKPDEKVIIYFTSPSGFVSTSKALLDFINNNKEIISLIVYGEIYSAGFDIVMKAECNKKLLSNTIGMIHFAYTKIDMDESGKPKTDYDKFYLAEMKKTKTETIEYLRTLGLNKQELEKVNKGKDVFLSYERLAVLFENSKQQQNQNQNENKTINS